MLVTWLQISAYLDKNDAVTWWALWLSEAKKFMEPVETIAMEGTMLFWKITLFSPLGVTFLLLGICLHRNLDLTGVAIQNLSSKCIRTHTCGPCKQ